MVLPNMTYVEAAAAIDREVGLCVPKIHQKNLEFGSMIKKSGPRTRFPVQRRYCVQSRDKTDIYIGIIAHRRSDWNRPKMTVYVPFHLRTGLFSAVISRNGHILVLFTDHFFTRYRERILKDTSIGSLETVHLFHARNRELVADFDMRCYRKRPSEEGDTVPVAAKVDEGNCFGEQISRDVFIMRTIVSNDMLYDDQGAAFSRLEEGRQMLLDVKNRRKA